VRSAEDIFALYRQRLERLGPDFARMRDVQETYNNDVVLPLPELSRNEQAAVANLTQQGLDAFARRVSSVLPTITYPPVRAGSDPERRAAKRRQINYGWWENTKIKKVTARRARWLLAYAAAPVIVRPDPVIECPRWDPHNPMEVFPSRVHLDCFTPTDVIVRHKRNYSWLATNYPEALMAVHKDRNADKNEANFEVLEYIDAEEVVFVLCGHTYKDSEAHFEHGAEAMEMVRRPNRAGICWAVIPSRVTLDRATGHFDSILGMYKTEAALMALEIIATRKAIYPTPWLVNPNNGAQPHIIQTPDPQTGEPGIITNGTLIWQQIDPSFKGAQVRQDLQYAQRQTAGLPTELGGMSQENVRTGRRGSQIMGAAIDFTLAEAQDAFAEALHDENIRAIAIDKAYFDTSKQFYVSTKGAKGLVSYKPSEVFETDQHIVEYPITGGDAADHVINGGQRIAQGSLSKRSFMELDPYVTDVDEEEQRIRFEGMEQGFYVALQTETSQLDGPWQTPDLARLAEKMFAKGLKWYEAVSELQKEKQEEQAEGAVPGSPETMPGLAMPGQGAEIPAVGETGPSMGNMASLLSQLGVTDQAMRMR
jgi:hypothetical protein